MLFTALPAGSSPFHFLKLVCIRTSISLPSIFNTQHALALLLIKHTLHHPFPRHPPKCYVIYRTWFFFMGCITFIKGDLQSLLPYFITRVLLVHVAVEWKGTTFLKEYILLNKVGTAGWTKGCIASPMLVAATMRNKPA